MKISSWWNAKIVNFTKFISLLKFPGLQYYQGTTIKRMVEKIWYQKENSKFETLHYQVLFC